MADNLSDISRTLVAPGAGLLSVTTGSDAQKELSSYFSKGACDSQKSWSSEIKKALKHDWVLLACPSDAGGGICRGAAHGPLGTRSALYKENPQIAKHDLGDIPCIPQLLHDSMNSKAQLDQSFEALFNKKRSRGESVSPLNLLADVLTELYKNKKQVFLLGGDHSVSWAPFEAFQKAKLKQNIGVLHLDAHTDLMEDRFGVEHCFATWAAHSVRKISNPANWFQVGIRVSRKSKKEWEKKFGLQQYWMKDVQRKTPEQMADVISQQWTRSKVNSFYVSLDIDALDPKWAPSTGTAEKGGFDLDYVKTLLHELCARFPLLGGDLVEVAPRIGSKEDAKITLHSAVECLKVLLP